MSARPLLVLLAVTLLGGGMLFAGAASLPPAKYEPALVGGACALSLTWALTARDLPRGARASMAGAVGVLGFFVGAALASFVPKLVWASGFAGAMLPAIVAVIAGVGREQHALELSRLENQIDDAATRGRTLERALAIRDAAEGQARSSDPAGTEAPDHAGDPRAVYAYAAQVVAYGLSLDRKFSDAVGSLGKVPVAWMPAPMRLLMLSNLAFWQLCVDDVDAAKKTVALGVESDSLPETRPNFRATRAFVLVRAGDADEALEIVGKAAGQGGEPERLHARYGIVRAHALFAKGDASAARAELERVREGGADEMRRWRDAKGPAAALVDELLA